MPFFLTVILITLLYSQGFSQGHFRCGTLDFAKNKKKLYKSSISALPCQTIANVKSEKTTHFQIFYTEEGEHQIMYAGYIDSLKKYLEEAYALHKNTLGMRATLGAGRTANFNQTVDNNLYPIEVFDLCKMCGIEVEAGSNLCIAAGATFPPENKRTTQIAIKNDFPNVPSYLWHLYLKVVVYHELYHAFQLTQYILTGEDSFWLEASATGVEEIGAPEVNDYINYFAISNAQNPRYFKTQGKPMEDTDIDPGYAYASLYLFLYKKFGEKFDAQIWERFGKDLKRQKTFSQHLTEHLAENGINAEDLFHEYAEAMYFSGSNTSKAEPFYEDMYMWPNWNVSANNTRRALPAGAIDFVKTAPDAKPNIDSAKMSVIESDGNSIWALSRLLNPKKEPKTEFVAYPNPWNPTLREKKLYFKGLGENPKGIEIRAANGALIDRVYGDFWEPKKNIAPGILYYRELPYGKNKVLIVRY